MIDDLEVRGRRVLVVGGSAAGLSTLSRLLQSGAAVTVVAAAVATTVRDLSGRGLLDWAPREVTAGDLAGAALVVAATGTVEGDDAVARQAAEHGLMAVRTTTTATASTSNGRVVLVGGGPGDPGLLTVAGLDAVKAADVVIADRLAPLAALAQARPGVQVVDVAKIPRGEFTAQERINDLLVEHARQGRLVVRLKGGDSFVFGRGGEEWQACVDAGIPVTVIPGVTSAIAAPALAGIPLTHRTLTQGFTVISGHLPPGDPGSTLDWRALAQAHTTLVVMMGVATLPAIAAELIAHGLDPDTPAATVADAGLASQREVRGRAADIAERTVAAEIRPPAITVIGAVAGLNLTG